MEDMKKDEGIPILESLFTDSNFVSFDDMEQTTGLTRNEIIRLKPELPDRLRISDQSICLTSLMHLPSPGFFLEDNG